MNAYSNRLLSPLSLGLHYKLEKEISQTSFPFVRSEMRLSKLVLLGLMVLTSSAHAQEKPNIVFIFMDNFGYGELGIYGGGITRGGATPRIDALAAEGIRLTNFNVEVQCTPSRAALMTGRYAIRSGNATVPITTGMYGLTQWEITMAGNAVGRRVRNGNVWKMAPGSYGRAVPHGSGFRRMVWHSELDGRKPVARSASVQCCRGRESESVRCTRIHLRRTQGQGAEEGQYL